MAIDKKINYNKPIVQGGVDNYLGKQPQVQAPRKWQSSPDKPTTELAYITEAEKDLILKSNIHGGLEGGPNMGPSGIMSLDSFGDVGGGGASGGDTSAGGGANEGASFSGRSVAEMDRTVNPRDKAFENRVANEKAALQIAERAQAQNLGYNERANIANATYGPLQKHTGERGFLGNLFRGANKYGYTDTYTSGPNQGQVKPGWGGRILGGLAGLATGIPFVGGAIGSVIDKGKGIFGRKPRDMSQFNRLGLGGTQPGTYDFDPNAQINQDVDTTGYSRFGNIGKPDLNNLESILAATAPQGIDNSMYGGDQDIYGVENARGLFRPSQQSTDFNTKYGPDGITYYDDDRQGITSLDQGTPFNNPVGGLDQFAKEVEMLEETIPNDYINISDMPGTLQDWYRNKDPIIKKHDPNNTMLQIVPDNINFNGNKEEWAPSDMDHSAKLGTLQTKEYETLKMGKELGMNTPEQNKKLDILEKLKNEASLRSETAIV